MVQAIRLRVGQDAREATMGCQRYSFLLYFCGILSLTGCHHPQVTAVPLSYRNQCEPEGIPFYLPKPLLIIAKNFRYVDEGKPGSTSPAPIPSTFDQQASYGAARASIHDGSRSEPMPSGEIARAAALARDPSDTAGPVVDGLSHHASLSPALAGHEGIEPETFYTYHIVFVPDLAQKYGLRIKGGAGEFRAAMNLVNGWMFTGLGPYYLKDSSTAQNLIAGGIGLDLTGRGVSEVIKGLAELKSVPGLGGHLESGLDTRDLAPLSTRMGSLQLHPINLRGYAEITVYEPELRPDGSTSWVKIIDQAFDREVVGLTEPAATPGPPRTPPASDPLSSDRSRQAAPSSQPSPRLRDADLPAGH